MKKTIRDYDLNDKRVIIRVDFNVPVIDQKIVDDSRIKASLDTINYAINHDAKVILLSHMGRIKVLEDKINNSLKVVSERLEELLNSKVIFIDETRGKKLEEAVLNLKAGEVLLVENTRFEDLNDKKESSNSDELASYWASLGDIFINDAFATSHRSHASNVGISSKIPSGIGFLVEKEVEVLENSINNPVRPFTVILGGAKVSDKIHIVKNMVKKADFILIGGGMAYTFLKAKGYEIGNSLVDNDQLEFCKDILANYSDKIILPIDNMVSTSLSSIGNYKLIDEINKDEIGLDIGKETVKMFKEYLSKSKTIIWNGTLGYCEEEFYSKGTKAICEVLKNLDATKIVGGGDTIAAITNLGYRSIFDHVSTGGGASLEMLEGKIMPAIGIISDKYE